MGKHHHGSPLGEDEIKLVRKKLKWSHEAFKIPNDLLNVWRKIGQDASHKAKNTMISIRKFFQNLKILIFSKI